MRSLIFVRAWFIPMLILMFIPGSCKQEPGKPNILLILAHELKKSGYVTAVAGKWQLCMLRDEPDHPHRLGFDEYCLFGWHEGPRYHQPLIWQNGVIRQDVKDRYGPNVYSDFCPSWHIILWRLSTMYPMTLKFLPRTGRRGVTKT